LTPLFYTEPLYRTINNYLNISYLFRRYPKFFSNIALILNSTLQTTPKKALKDKRNQNIGVHPPIVMSNAAVIIPIIRERTPPRRKIVINVSDPSDSIDDFSIPTPHFTVFPIYFRRKGKKLGELYEDSEKSLSPFSNITIQPSVLIHFYILCYTCNVRGRYIYVLANLYDSGVWVFQAEGFNIQNVCFQFFLKTRLLLFSQSMIPFFITSFNTISLEKNILI
jgi:hypothetical protein